VRAEGRDFPRLERVGLANSPLSDHYHRLLLMSWGRLFLLVVAGYVGINVLFALVWMAVPGAVDGCRPYHFGDAFSFSVQTFSTIGYGAMSPVGTFANTIVTLEAILGLIYQALVTGVTFAKFARPTARVLFTEKLCMTEWEGDRVLMLRMGNERGNQVVEARLTLTLLLDEITAEGRHFRKLRELPLVRPATPVFVYTWTAFHVIDESSPLHGLSDEDLVRGNAQILATLVGTDDTFNQMVHARALYDVEDVAWDHHFADILKIRDDGSRYFDYSRFHEVEPDAHPPHDDADGVRGLTIRPPSADE